MFVGNFDLLSEFVNELDHPVDMENVWFDAMELDSKYYSCFANIIVSA